MKYQQAQPAQWKKAALLVQRKSFSPKVGKTVKSESLRDQAFGFFYLKGLIPKFESMNPVFPTSGLPDFLTTNTKHEIITCERCGARMECKANVYAKCQCSAVQLNLNEVQYISENYEGCMCAACLLALQKEYRVAVGISA
jgi:hypothetical protein